MDESLPVQSVNFLAFPLEPEAALSTIHPPKAPAPLFIGSLPSRAKDLREGQRTFCA